MNVNVRVYCNLQVLAHEDGMYFWFASLGQDVIRVFGRGIERTNTSLLCIFPTSLPPSSQCWWGVGRWQCSCTSRPASQCGPRILWSLFPASTPGVRITITQSVQKTHNRACPVVKRILYTQPYLNPGDPWSVFFTLNTLSGSNLRKYTLVPYLLLLSLHWLFKLLNNRRLRPLSLALSSTLIQAPVLLLFLG